MMKCGRDGVAAGVSADFSIVIEAGGDPFDFVPVLAPRLAAFLRHDRRELFLTSAQVAGDGVKHLCFFYSGKPAPGLEGFAGGANSQIGVSGGAA